MFSLGKLAARVVVKDMDRLQDNDAPIYDGSGVRDYANGDFVRPDEKLRHEFHCHNPYAQISLEDSRLAVQSLTSEFPLFTRAVGSLLGLAVGDSVGAPLEFLPASEIPNSEHCVATTKSTAPVFPWIFGQTDKVLQGLFYTGALNNFELKEGQWTDDTSMALCLADSLIFKGKYDGVDIRFRFLYWLKYGYCNAFGRDPDRYNQISVGLGGNIAKSLRSIHTIEDITPRYIPTRPNEDSGNGSIMRLAPTAIFYHHSEENSRMYSREQSYTTHPGEIAAEACEFLGFLLFRILNHPLSETISFAQFLDIHVTDYLEILKSRSSSSATTLMEQLLSNNSTPRSTEACWNWRAQTLAIQQTLKARGSNYNGYPNSAGYFGSYCMDALAIALHSCYTTDGFEQAILKTINFLGDADSTGAVTGQIAGAFYGYNEIPTVMKGPIEKWDNGSIAFRAALLYFRDNANIEN
ncbi:hypothetical protein HK100_004912 [Physocladia obscura]|uniref:ADP-ribosylglycohydrolase n=1 Tax=Physocladia obscura TaxID=109957 RepID=A0AAD5SSC7_9FUNG|nr:hypothetical protein HK100_004912 [Physocladia obscura]